MRTFREAEESDVESIVGMVKAFNDKYISKVSGIEFVDEDMRSTVVRCMREGFCAVGKTSCAGALFQDFPCNYSYVNAYVVFVCFKDAADLKIFEYLMGRVKHLGATHICAASHYPDFRMARYYKRLGLTPSELHSIVRLN